MKRILNIGLPNAGESIINWSANFALVKIVNTTPPVNVAAAAHGNAIRIESISYMTGFAVAVAVATMVGQSLGMRQPRRAARCAYLAYLVGGGFMTLVGIFFIFFSRYPAAFLADAPAIRETFGLRFYDRFAAHSLAFGITRSLLLATILLAIAGLLRNRGARLRL